VASFLILSSFLLQYFEQTAEFSPSLSLSGHFDINKKLPEILRIIDLDA